MGVEFLQNFARAVIKEFTDESGKRVRIFDYLGKVVSRFLNIFTNKKEGMFHYDPETGKHEPVSEELLAKLEKELGVTISVDEPFYTSRKPTVVTFGGEFLLNEVISTSGIAEVITKTFPDAKDADTCKSLIITNLLNIGSSRQIENWADGSILPFLCPKAQLKSQRVSEFYERAGSAATEASFYNHYTDYLFNKCGLGGTFQLDSTGARCSSKKITLANFWKHEGDTGYGPRVALLQEFSSMPAYAEPFSGNINDKTTYGPMIYRLDALGINIEHMIDDCGYYSAKNIDVNYKDNVCIHDYIMKVKKDTKLLTQFTNEGFTSLIKSENATPFGGKVFYVDIHKVNAGTKHDKPAYLYVIFDNEKFHNDVKQIQKEFNEGKFDKNEYNIRFSRAGMFGLISGEKHTGAEILYLYNTKLTLEQSFDFSKNYAGLLPIRVHNDLTLHGRLLVWMLSLAVLRIIQIMLKSYNMDIVSFFNTLKKQYAHVYKNTIVVDSKRPDVNAIFAQLKINLPDKLELRYDGTVKYEHSEIPVTPEWSTLAKKYDPNTSEEPTLKPQKSKKDKTDAKKSNKEQSGSTNGDKQPIKKKTPGNAGRIKGSENHKTIERRNFLQLLTNIRDKKAADEGMTPEDIEKMDKEIESNNVKVRGRKAGSKNKTTLLYEALESDAKAYIDKLAVKLSMTHEEVIKYILSLADSSQDADTTTTESRGQGRPKGSYNQSTLETHAIERVVVAMIVAYAECLNLDVYEFVDFVIGKTPTCSEKDSDKDVVNDQEERKPEDRRGRKKGQKNAKTLIKEANLERGEVFLKKFQSENSLSRDEAIKLLWKQNNPFKESTTGDRPVGRPKGSYGLKRIESLVLQASGSCMAEMGDAIVYTEGLLVPFFEL